MLTREDVSRTARLVAACRALDAERPPADRLIQRPDRWARDLTGDEALGIAAELPQLVTGIGLRTRWLDDELAAFAARHGGGQVVLLGAGLDTRPLRLGLPLRFFEIDLPGMLEHKASVVGAGASTLLPVDLRHERFADALAACPTFARDAPTCVVWEGVTYYLAEAPIRATLDQVREVLPPADAGLLLFDYVKASWLEAVQRRGTGGIVAQVATWREPLVFGFADVRATLAGHGLELLRDVLTSDLAGDYGVPEPLERWYAARMAAARRAA